VIFCLKASIADLHLEGRRINQAGNQREAGSKPNWSPYSSTLKMEEICSSETSVDFQRTTRRVIPKDKAQDIRKSDTYQI
jgi:hypothetical protein